MHLSAYFKQESEKYIPQLAEHRPAITLIRSRAAFSPEAAALRRDEGEEELDKALKEGESKLRLDVRRLIQEANSETSLRLINELLRCTKLSELYGISPDDADMVDAFNTALTLTSSIIRNAEYEFRRFPSSENYAKWISLRRLADLLGADEVPPPGAVTFVPCGYKSYTVKSGDTLSRLALRFYGKENLWDVIYEQNGCQGHPDLIYPGTVLYIP